MYQLHIRVIEAKDCPKFDNCNASDPYVIIRVNGTEQKTKVISNNNNPIWNQEFHFDIQNPSNGVIEMKMKDSDGPCQGKDDDMCTLNLSFCSYPVGQVIDNWYDMTACKKKKGAAKIHLTINIVPAGTPPFTQLAGYPGQPGYPPQGGYPQMGYPPR